VRALAEVVDEAHAPTDRSPIAIDRRRRGTAARDGPGVVNTDAMGDSRKGVEGFDSE
jgi:hypothetical protein